MDYMKDNKKLLIIIGVFFILSIGFIIYQNNFYNSKINKICIGDKTCYNIEIADSDEEKTTGLSGVEFLNESDGMLFVFDEETIPRFWTLDMKFSIDVVWINKEKVVIGIERSLIPCNGTKSFDCEIFYPKVPIKYVLEVNSNSTIRHNINYGDLVIFW